jgi:hypothetical protein
VLDGAVADAPADPAAQAADEGGILVCRAGEVQDRHRPPGAAALGRHGPAHRGDGVGSPIGAFFKAAGSLKDKFFNFLKRVSRNPPLVWRRPEGGGRAPVKWNCHLLSSVETMRCLSATYPAASSPSRSPSGLKPTAETRS